MNENQKKTGQAGGERLEVGVLHSDAVFRAVREDEREACVALWRTVWPGENSEAYFRKYFYGDVEWLPYYTQVAVVEEKIVSAVQICKRTVACGDFRLTMGGIANVATLPEFRGRGYNTALMQRAVSVMEADAMDFSLLFTGIHSYYARLGYSTVPRPGLTGVVRPDFAPRPSTYRVRPVRAEELPAVRSLYDVYNRQRPIAVQRYEAYWREWMKLSPERLPDTLLVAVDADEQVCGYINTGVFLSAKPYSADEAPVRVIEFGGDNRWLTELEEEALTVALLDAVVGRIVAAGSRSLRLDIPLEPPVLKALETILLTRERTTSHSGMMRLLHRTNLLQSLTLEFTDRWMAAGRPGGMLTFETPYGPVSLNASGPFLRVEPSEDSSAALPQETFFGLLFGLLTPQQIPTDPSLSLLLEALFPFRAFIYWGADGF